MMSGRLDILKYISLTLARYSPDYAGVVSLPQSQVSQSVNSSDFPSQTESEERSSHT